MVKPYKLSIPQDTLDDLQERLQRTRWPDQIQGSGWKLGTNLDYMQELAGYWQNGYDWRAQETTLNGFAWFTATIDDNELCFIHERGQGPNPTPLILLHGWPDSVVRYLKLIPMLTNPGAHGGDPNQSFDVIVPSLVGYKANAQDTGLRQHPFKHIAQVCWQLMTAELGYQKFGAVGGDGGSPLAQLMAVDHPDSIIGLHLTDLGFQATMGDTPDPSKDEQKYLQKATQTSYQEGAYAMQMGTKPQTLAYGLTDSPVGMAAWIIEKFHTWSDCHGKLEDRYTKDELLTNIMFYWTAPSAVRAFSYAEEFMGPSLAHGQLVTVPVAVANPPKDIAPIPPREFAERTLKDLRRWTTLDEGGHFAAMEVPQLMAADIRTFFNELGE
jgi:pimeloyl-ACP methyl ester carboxylesterase